MAWFDSFTLVMRSSVTALREKVENPERMIHQLIVDMEEELETVRAHVAEAIADEIQMGRRVDKAREEADQWMDRASRALKRGDETNAKSALDQKVRAEQHADMLHIECEKQKQQTAKLQQSVRELEDKIRQARHKQTLLLARMSRAESSRRIHNAMDQAGGRSAFAQFNRLEERVERAEAVDKAYDRMDGRDPDADELAHAFAEEEREARVLDEFEELKRRVDSESD
jgi:phage shock protein A